MLKLVFNGVRRNFSLRHRTLILYSTVTKPSDEKPPHFMVDYLEDSLGFSREEAVTASKKVSRLKSLEKPNSVVNLFRQLGINKSQMKTIFSVNTYLLSISDKTLAPKIRVFQDLGFSGSELGTMLASNPSILTRRLEAHINPLVKSLRLILGSDENVVKAIKRSFLLVSSNVPKRILRNLALLKSYGLSDERIRKLVLTNPRNLICHPESLEKSLRVVEETIGIPRGSQMFIHGIDAMSSSKKQTMESKFRVFKSYGWTQEDIMTMARCLPHCLKASEKKIRSGLDLFMKELGYLPGYIACHPKLLMYSMEKRVLPRMAFWEVLMKKELIKANRSLYSILCISNELFLKNYVVPFKNEVPELCEAYIRKTCDSKVICLKDDPFIL